MRADEPVAAIVDFFRDERLLIVLDNCEQVIEAVAGLADRILRETAETHMLITSREPLRIAGERVHRLAPLECPPVKPTSPPARHKAYAAVQLFIERATASIDGFSLDDASAPAVSEICRRLDGIPLAIELAAARVEFFGVATLASQLDNMFAVLTQGRRFALPRHQTLRATLDWGYNLLSPTEQTVLRRIAIFRATFTLDLALAVVVGPAVSVENAIDAMANLVAKSLLSADSTGEHRAVSIAGGDPPLRHRKARGQRRGAADRAAARRTSFDLDRDRAKQLAIRCRETMVAASCRTDRRLSGGARLVVLTRRRPVDRSPSHGEFDTAVAPVCP